MMHRCRNYLCHESVFEQPKAAYNEGYSMTKRVKRVLALVLVWAACMSVVACASEQSEKNYDGPALVASILAQVQFADTLKDVGDSATLYFSDLPEGTQVKLYLGSGYYADEVALLTLAKASDAAAVKEAAKAHVAQQRNQFANYIPEELGKIDQALIWEGGSYVIICISDRVADAKLILDNGTDPNYKLPGGSSNTTTNTTTVGGTTTQPPVTTAPPATSTPAPTTPITTARPTLNQNLALDSNGYPILMSLDGRYYKYSNGMIRIDNCAYEVCGYSDSVAETYAQLVSKVADALAGKTKVYSLAIPTSYGVMVPNDIQMQMTGYGNQGQYIENVIAKYSSNVTPVRCFDNLMRHRNEYLYFRTDHHWNGIGAYYAYEAFCETKGIKPYTMQQREEVQFDNFLGTLYTHTEQDQNLLPADTVYAYMPMSKSATLTFYDNAGKGTNWSIIADVTNWNSGGKYNTFAGGDNPLTVIQNPEVTDGSVCIVIKESYGNALIPYLVDHYSAIYEIDYRYWTGDLVQYAQEVGADDIIFANNIMMISTGILVGKLSNIIK